jgi:hypothetical protein
MNRQIRSRRATLVLWLTLVPFRAAHLAGAGSGLLRAVSLAFLAAGSAHAAPDWPELPLPPKADVQWIAQSMRVNGMPTRVQQFQSRASRAEIVEYYRAHWMGGYPQKPSVKAVKDSTVVGQRHGPYLMTVTVRDAPRDGSQGLIAVAQVAGSKVDLEPGELPLMPGAHVVRVVESDDPGKHSRDLIVINPQPPRSVAQFYLASLQNAGWQRVQLNDIPHTERGGGGSFMAFARGGSEMQISVVEPAKSKGTWLIANQVTKDTGPGSF